jgi:hypothetical protein
MKATTKRLSICECGFLILAERIPLGTEYEINTKDKIRVKFTCGGCGRAWMTNAVWVEHRDDSHGGYLPEAVFTAPSIPAH